MNTPLEGEEESLWIATTAQTNYPTLDSDDTAYDVAIVGGGITGIMAAYHLQKRGLSVVMIEKNRLVEWTTGSTTAKLSSQHYLIYDFLIQNHGVDAARAYAHANQTGIDDVGQISRQLGIDCEFSRRSAYVYTRESDKVDAIKAEVKAAKSLGLPASFETTIDLPFDITAAIKFADQAQFHPRKFLLGLADNFGSNGGVIYEQTEATDIEPGEINSLKTNHGYLRAKYILQASGEPFWNKEIFDGYMWMKMSYALAVRLKEGSDYPNGMYITTDDPMRTIRSATYDEKPVLIFGGESHEYDEKHYDPDPHYQNLVKDVHEKYDVDKVLFRWLAGDYMPYDRMPYFGAMPAHPNIYVITGYRAWGLAWAMSATQAIASDIAGQPEEWARYFSLNRLSRVLPESMIRRGY